MINDGGKTIRELLRYRKLNRISPKCPSLVSTCFVSCISKWLYIYKGGVAEEELAHSISVARESAIRIQLLGFQSLGIGSFGFQLLGLCSLGIQGLGFSH